jgi:ABC-2 type transport system ATP-binding protein
VPRGAGEARAGRDGHNGAGKTTLLSLCTGQLRPSSGSLFVIGERPWNNPELLARIGYCPELDSFWRGLTGLQFVRLLARLSGLTERKADAAARHAIDRVGMADNQDRRVAEYSRGMRQRIKIAQALAHDPELLILDEPLAGTDPVGRASLIELFRELAAAGKSIIVSSHILHEVEAMTRSIVLVDHGKLVAHGDVRDIRDVMEAQSRQVLVRTPQTRRLAAMLIGREEVAAVQIPDGDCLILRTDAPEQLLGELPGLLIREGIACSEISAPDENLEAVFGYLTRRSSETAGEGSTR